MRSWALVPFVLVTGACAINIHKGPPAPVIPSDDETLAGLAWLEGTWFQQAGARESEEHWSSGRGGTMVGMVRTVALDGMAGGGAADGAARTAGHEFLLIEHTADGIFYRSAASSAESVAYRLVTLEGERAVFAGPAGGYPERITYYTKPAEEGPSHLLCTRLEGTADGQPKSAEWCYVRAAPVGD